MLDKNFMAIASHFHYAGRGNCYPVFMVLDFARNANLHEENLSDVAKLLCLPCHTLAVKTLFRYFGVLISKYAIRNS